MDPNSCVEIIRQKGYCVVHCDDGSSAQELETVCRSVMQNLHYTTFDSAPKLKNIFSLCIYVYFIVMF